MGKRDVNVWWDAESDFLSVTFDGKDGFTVETTDDRVMAKVDEDGNITGLHILGLSTIEDMASDTTEVSHEGMLSVIERTNTR